jgi:transaldolase
MPEATIRATADHAELHGDAIDGTYEDSRRVFEELEVLGVKYDDVVAVLEQQGVDKFAASWTELLQTINREMAAGGSTT